MTDKALLEFLKIIFEPTFKRDEFNNVAVFTMFNENYKYVATFELNDDTEELCSKLDEWINPKEENKSVQA